MKEVSIIIPVYNREKWVSEAIESALAQTYKKIEVVVVNDGSTDKSETEILKFKDRIKYIKQGNMGPAVARNAGIKAAKGSFIVPLDSDDKLDPLFIEKLLPFMDRFDFVSTWVKVFGKRDEILRWGPYDGEKHFKSQVSLAYCALFKKKMWVKIGGYKVIKTKKGVHGYEDWEFWVSAWKHSYKGYVHPEPLFHYRKHGYSLYDQAKSNKEELTDLLKSLHPDLYR